MNITHIYNNLSPHDRININDHSCCFAISTDQISIYLVGAGIPLTSTNPVAGSLQAIALGLVPAGLTPVAFFPPTPNQTMQAFTVVFQEPVGRQSRLLHAGRKGFSYILKP